MKQFFAATLLFTSMAAIAVSPDDIKPPESYGNTFVSDTANIIDGAKEKELDDALVQYYKATGVQVAVVTTPDTDGSDSPRTFANQLFEMLELGDPELDNGLLMLLSVGDRRIEFETGYGLEGLLPDVTQFRIQQKYMIPFFKEGDYQQGLLDGTYATLIELNKASEREAAITTKNAADSSLGLLSNDAQTSPVNGGNGSSTNVLVMIGFGLLGLVSLAMLAFVLLLSRRHRESVRQLKQSQDFVGKLERHTATEKPPTKHTCDSCGKATIEITPYAPAISAVSQTRHLSQYEQSLIAHNLADITLVKCPECWHINTEISLKCDLYHCLLCSEKSRYSLGFSEFLLTNQFNTYADTIERTQSMQKMVFKSVKLGWQENTHARNNITYCFICDDIKEERGQDYIERAPVKPKPQPKRDPEPRHVSTKKTTPSNKPSSTPPSSPSWTSFGSSSSSGSTKTRTASKSRSSSRSTPTPRKRGGKSGGGGAGSSW